MKIAVSAKGGSLNAQMDERIGQCEYFIIVDSETMGFNAVFNPSATASGGTGDPQQREQWLNMALKC
ncbi:MAG: hypothetical protein JSW07_01850 [bacterium]|nr:MAG: hypothetical protein JSW07_01850 [bacterium]